MDLRASRLLPVLLVGLYACAGDNPPPPVAPSPPPPPAAPLAPMTDSPPASASATATAPASTSAPAAPQLTSKAVPLPGASAPAFLDYIVADRARGRVWVPVGNTGSVDVYDIASGAFTRVDGFKTVEREMRGKKRTLGPSAVTIGDGVAYIGNRATSEVCVVDVKTLKLGKCLKLPASTDGVVYVASAKEVWVTTPDDKSLTVLDASKPDALKPKTVIKFDGEPEGYAVDDKNGLFFTNLEDKGGTVVVDIKTHKQKTTWSPGCDEKGPRGLAIDVARGLLMVACTDHVQVLDAGHDGAKLGRFDTGMGVDNLDWLEEKGLLIAGAGKDARLTIAKIDDKGQPTIVATGATAEGARNPVGDANGNAYIADSKGAQLLIFAR